ncbi:cytochrome c oxidase assembly protein subunit 15 [Pedobacter sp. UYP30]|uniref:COX15/CtaA family protein n=1 Tax=Pedobacter sp. UYP30 TaxID=1756400 RepID=UPI003397FAF6
MISRSEKRFIRINFIAIIITLLVIVAGGVVRSTGSGMGCPDWPKCFGNYIPPTNVSQLPANYQERYVAQRLKKNEKFAKYLDKYGKHDLAKKIREDKSITQPEEFNAAYTWTEYINRLIGMLTGLAIVLTAVCSFTYRKSAKRIVVLSVLNVALVGYQAWLGSIVVSTNLTQWIVTVHMLLALVILSINIYTYSYAKQLHKQKSVIMYRIAWLKGFLLFALGLSILQIILGTEVREEIDVVSKALLDIHRGSWVEQVGKVFHYHRNLALLVIVANGIIYKMVIDRFSGKAAPLLAAKGILILLAIQILSGVMLAYLGLPPIAQVIHLTFSMMLFSLEFYLYLLVENTETYKH